MLLFRWRSLAFGDSAEYGVELIRDFIASILAIIDDRMRIAAVLQ